MALVRNLALAGATSLLGLVAAGCSSDFGAGARLLGATTPTTSGSSTTAGAATATRPTLALPAGVTLRQIVIETDRLAISQPGYGLQLQAAGVFSDGRVRDVTRFATWAARDPSVASVDVNGVASPKAAGTTAIEATLSGVTAAGTLDVLATALGGGAAPPPPATANGPTWRGDVFPLFRSTLSCKNCHDASGPGRLKLTLNEMTDFTTMTTAGLIDRASPAASLVIAKGTRAVQHGGGAAMAPGGPEAKTIEAWIAAGAPLDGAPAAAPAPAPGALPAPDALLLNPVERNLVDPGQVQQVLVLASWKNGTSADVTRLATYAFSSANVARIDSEGLVTATGVGTVTLTATWQGVSASAQLAFDPAARLPNGDAPSPVVPPVAAAPAPGAPATPGTPTPTPPPLTLPANPTFAQDVDPLFYNRLSCSGCHTPTAGDFHLYRDVARDYSSVKDKVDTGRAASSELLEKGTNKDGDHPGGKALDPASVEYQIILRWIQQGAKP